MPFTNFKNGITSFGIPVVGGGNMFGAQNKVFFVAPLTGSDSHDGKSPKTAFATVQHAHDACTSGKNDVVYFLSEGSTSSSSGTQEILTTAITWTKSFTHLIGVCPPLAMSMRCRIGTVTAMTPMITISGSSCVFKNIQFSQNHSHATAGAVCCHITGARNYFENVQFQNLGALAVVNSACRPCTIASSNGENRFVNCAFGSGTMDGVTASGCQLEFTGANETARNVFEGCYFLGDGSANSVFFKMGTQSGGSAFQKFERCLFFNNTNGTLDEYTQAFSLSATCGCFFFMIDNMVYGAATYETSNTGLLLGRNAYAAATTDLALVLTF